MLSCLQALFSFFLIERIKSPRNFQGIPMLQAHMLSDCVGFFNVFNFHFNYKGKLVSSLIFQILFLNKFNSYKHKITLLIASFSGY
jgi:hypothetical protein